VIRIRTNKEKLNQTKKKRENLKKPPSTKKLFENVKMSKYSLTEAQEIEEFY